MTTLSFSKEIDAPSEIVWDALWQEQNYLAWTSVFCQGGYAETDNWTKGSRVRFLSPDGSGMYSIVTENRQYEQMEFTHLGEIKNFEEQGPTYVTEETRGAKEQYTLTQQDGSTILTVYVDVDEKHEAFFGDVFLKGLEAVKQIAEKEYHKTDKPTA